MAATAERIDRNHYAVLGVPETATDREITRAYRRLARELHPDTGGESADGARFREVADAYAVLHAPERRREYDRARRSARMSGAAGRTHGTPVRVNRRRSSRRPAGGLGDLVGDGFADVPPDGRGRWVPRARRGADLAADPELSFEEAVTGTTSRLHVGDRTVTARIPAGVADGSTIRLPGRGEPGVDGGPAGDLRVRVRVRPHPLLRRRGRDLAVTVPITFPEAVLGADVRVPALDGAVTVRVPPGTRSGTTLRVRGRGVPSPEGPGDLLVTVEIDVPQQLGNRQRAAVEALAAAIPGSPRSRPGA